VYCPANYPFWCKYTKKPIIPQNISQTIIGDTHIVLAILGRTRRMVGGAEVKAIQTERLFNDSFFELLP